MANWQHYWKGILGFLVPGAVIIGSAVLSDSDGGATITASEWVTAIVAMIVTGGVVTAKSNADETPPVVAPPAEPQV
jgi:hypothetical protein